MNMNHENRRGLAILLAGVAMFAVARVRADERPSAATSFLPNLVRFDDEHGEFASFSLQGGIDTRNPFFQDLGSNGRRCVTCHQPDNGWTVTPGKLRLRFLATRGTDPI